MTADGKEYIGDGVYAEMSGYMVRLSTERHSEPPKITENGGVIHEIYLEPAVYVALEWFIKNRSGWKLGAEE